MEEESGTEGDAAVMRHPSRPFPPAPPYQPPPSPQRVTLSWVFLFLTVFLAVVAGVIVANYLELQWLGSQLRQAIGNG